MTHRQAMELVEQHGGASMQNVGLQTTLLVIGEEGWPLEPDGLPSTKLDFARQLHERGEPIRIVSESEWLKLLGIEPPERKTRQLYTPAMLCQLLNVSVHEIRKWERAGLIKPVKKVYRLPYFDFEEVASARRLCKLAASGVRTERISASLRQLHSLLPNVERPLAQLEVLSLGSKRLAFRDESGLIEVTGQRLFDFDPPVEIDLNDDDDSDTGPATIPIRPVLSDDPAERQRWSDDQWFQEGCRLAESNEISSAIEALRLATIGDPQNPSYHFHLADALYRGGKPHAAIERYHVAVEHDHNFLEAWTQLGCVLSEVGDLANAKVAFQIALELHRDYPEAHFHLAGVLDQLGKADEAASHWQIYLEFDQRGPWAEIARERLADSPQQTFPAE